jgi:photosystem II stability/assembly factor-like uncharacterized protein
MCFTGAHSGYAVGDSGIVYRTNNGTDWYIVQISDYSALRSIAFSPSNLALGLAVGRIGAVKWTKNNGDTWSQDTSSILQGIDFNNVCFTPNGNCYIVGAGGVIFKYANNRWSAVASPTKNDLLSVFFADNSYGFITGKSGAIYKTKDGGATWKSQNGNTAQDLYGIVAFRGAMSFNGTDSVDATDGYIVGNSGVVRRTTDGGVTWLTADPGLGAGGVFKGLHFTSKWDGVVAGSGGAIYSTTNAGISWRRMTTATQHNLNGVWLVSNSTGWAVGDSGTVLFNGNVALPVELSSFNGWAEGNNAALSWSTASELHSSSFQIERRASNGNWQSISSVTATGSVSQGATYQYVDKGLSPNVYYYRLKEVDNDGSSQYIGNAVEITIGAPAQVVLYQNYPNPSNSSTGISFDLAKNGNVRLVVTDMAGRIVGTIQDGQMQAGHYTMNFDGSNLPAGTYIYRMEVNGTSYSRQMTFVR